MRWFRKRDSNLAANRPYEIGAQWPDPLFSDTEKRQYPDKGQVTSGQVPSASRKDPNWIGLLRQYGRSITVDLGEPCHIEDVQVAMLEDGAAGIFLPDSVHAYASIDGKSWRRLGSVDSPPPKNEALVGKALTQTFVITCDANARYVRLQCVAKVFLFVGGLSVHGEPDKSSTRMDGYDLVSLMGRNYLVDPATYTQPSPDMRLKLTHETLMDFHHMQLVYSGLEQPLGTWTVDDFWPMVVGLDENKRPVRHLFDAALFLPQGKMKTSASAWRNWLSHLFAQSAQLAALDEAVARANDALGTPDHRVTVVLTLPGTNANPGEFGSITDGRPSLNFNPQTIGYKKATEQKAEALLWFMRLILAEFSSAALPHLRLGGFYWQPESVNVTNPYDTLLIRQIADAIHAENQRFYWIPIYGAAGFTDAASLGFDGVMLQPNAAFHPEVNTEQRVELACALAEAYGAGLEMELHWDVLSADRDTAEGAKQRYVTYLQTVARHPYARTAIKAYYLGSKTLVECWRKENPVAHSVYEATESFISQSR